MARRTKKDESHKNTQDSYSRKKDTRNKVLSVIIACEDEVSAPTYFKMIVEKLKDSKVITQDSLVIANHKHNTPTGVLSDLLSHKEDGKSYKDFEHKWIVIDRDAPRVNGGGHLASDFNGALSSAKSKKVEVAYANDSYELWYLLHFNPRTTAILRDEILKEVIKKLKEKNPTKFRDLDNENIKNKKYTEHIYEELLELQATAIRNAERLLQSYGETHNPECDNPSTTIHKLVEILNSFYPNDSIELWYLLHFMPVNNVISKNEILEELIKKLKEKNQTVFKDLDITNFKESIYIKPINDELVKLQTEALKNAKTFLNLYEKNKYPKLIGILNSIESK